MQHSDEFVALVDDAKTRVREVTVVGWPDLATAGALLVDVREDREWAAGHAAGAHHFGRGVIERDVVQAVPDKGQALVLYCGGGFRSALAADNLHKMGYRNVYSLAGGWKAWVAAGLPTQAPG